MAQFKLLFSDRAKCFSATHPFSGDIGKIIVFDPRKQEILFEPMISNLRYNKDKILINEFDYK